MAFKERLFRAKGLDTRFVISREGKRRVWRERHISNNNTITYIITTNHSCLRVVC